MSSERTTRRRRAYDRVVRISADYLGGQRIPSMQILNESIDEQVRDGARETDVTLAVVQDFEQASAALSTRTAPLVPASGLVVTASGLLAPLSDAASTLVFTAMLFAIVGLLFLTASLFTHAGRRTVGIPPTRGDVAFAQSRLIFKDGNARIGSAVFAFGLLLLIAAILTI